MSEKTVQIAESQSERLAEGYMKKYPEHVKALESSLLSKVESIGPWHITQLGKQLDAFSAYKRMSEANGTLNNLGQLPKLSFDVITAVMGASPIPVIASVQAIEAQKGIIHFRNVAASITKGNLSANQKIVDPRTGEVVPKGYASNLVQEVVGTGDGTETDFSAILASKPARSQFLSVAVSGSPALKAKDIGPESGGNKDIGQIYGQGLHGTINYVTGAIDLFFADAVPNLAQIVVSYQENYEAAEDIPKIESYWDSIDIEAQVYALKATIGMLQSYTLQKQYGESAMDELAKDLIRAINTEIMGDFVSQLTVGAVGTTTFDLTPGTGTSFFEHKQEYFDKLNFADAEMTKNAGRGKISVMVVGRDHAAFIAGLPGFKKLSDGRSLGAHIFGELNGVVYVRVPQDVLMSNGDTNPAALLAGSRSGLGIFKGDSPFDAACVYSPFMPIMSTDDLPVVKNPLLSQKAAATMAGVKLIVPQYATKLNLIKS